MRADYIGINFRIILTCVSQKISKLLLLCITKRKPKNFKSTILRIETDKTEANIKTKIKGNPRGIFNIFSKYFLYPGF